MIREVTYKNRRGWYSAPRALYEKLRGVTGVGPLNDEKILIHRSHLPLLADDLDAAKLLVRINQARDPWSIRNARTAKLGFKLRTVQHQAVDFISNHHGALLTDEMRVGKSLSAIMSHDPGRGPLVVIAPLLTRGMWLGWLHKAFPDLRIGALIGRTFDRSQLDNDVVFCHYDVVHSWQTTMKIGTIVFDECHLITNKDSRRSKACTFLASQSDMRIAMTGTPIWDMVPDLWNILGLVVPAAFGSYWDFCMRYASPQPSAYGTRFVGASRADELRARMSEVMLRRRWIDVADDLPPITRSIVVAEVSDDKRRALDILAGEMKSDRTNTAGALAHYRSKLCKVKLSATIKQAKKYLDAGEPVVIWTWHRDFAKEIAEQLLGSYLIHGELAVDKRDEIIGQWKGSQAKPLIATMAVAQVGIDLSHASNEIFAELDYTPAMIAQAEMRTYDPKRPMNVIFIVADHVVDQRIVRALISKLSAANPLGVGAAIDAIDALRIHVLGVPDDGDMVRFLDDLLATEHDDE